MNKDVPARCQAKSAKLQMFHLRRSPVTYDNNPQHFALGRAYLTDAQLVDVAAAPSSRVWRLESWLEILSQEAGAESFIQTLEMATPRSGLRKGQKCTGLRSLIKFEYESPRRLLLGQHVYVALSLRRITRGQGPYKPAATGAMNEGHSTTELIERRPNVIH